VRNRHGRLDIWPSTGSPAIAPESLFIFSEPAQDASSEKRWAAAAFFATLAQHLSRSFSAFGFAKPAVAQAPATMPHSGGSGAATDWKSPSLIPKAGVLRVNGASIMMRKLAIGIAAAVIATGGATLSASAYGGGGYHGGKAHYGGYTKGMYKPGRSYGEYGGRYRPDYWRYRHGWRHGYYRTYGGYERPYGYGGYHREYYRRHGHYGPRYGEGHRGPFYGRR
jgi:hypothetical protein